MNNYKDSSLSIIKSYLKGDNVIYFILLLALALRVHNFSSTSIWYDESVTVRLAHDSWLDIYRSSTKDVNAPFYPFLIKIWTYLFGFSLSSIRFFSVICSVFTVAVIFKIADVNFGRRAALVSSALITFSNIHIYYSEEARCYALLSLLSALSLFYFFELIKLPNTKNLILYSFFSLITIYTQLFFGLQIAVSAFIFFVIFRKDKNNLKKLLLYHLIIGLIFSVWFLKTFVSKNGVNITDSWIPPISYDNMLWFFRDVFNHDYLAYFYVIFFILSLPLMILIFFNGNLLIKRRFVYLTILFVFPFLGMCLFSAFYTSVFYPRFVLFTSITLFLTLGVIISQLSKYKLVQLFFIIPLITGIINIKVFAFRNQDWNIACRYEWAFRNENTSTIVSPSYSDMCYIYYNMDWAYFQEYNNLWYFKDERKMMGCDDSLQYIKSKFSKSNRVVLFDATPDYDDRLILYFKNNYDSVFAKKLYGINFYVFDMKKKDTTINSKQFPSLH